MKRTYILDKNGREIMEGDEVLQYCPHCDAPHRHGKVMFMNKPGVHVGWIFRYEEEKEDISLMMYEEETGDMAPLEIVKR